MRADRASDLDLPAILVDLYLGRTPDYRDEVLAAVFRTRQRPAWAFPGRWLPMADIAQRPALVPRIPVRTLGLALLLVALLATTVVLVVGSRQTDVPAPFGLARNGLIAYSVDGDIYTADPETGTEAVVVASPHEDSEPRFSPDGTRVAFLRAGPDGDEIVVASIDGTNPRVVTTATGPAGVDGFEWAPDSGSLLVDAPEHAGVWLLDASAAGAPRLVADAASSYMAPFRPPNGSGLLLKRMDGGRRRLVVLDLERGTETVLAEGQSSDDLSVARWSPDGSQVVYNAVPKGDPSSQRLFVVNADGTGVMQITRAPGVWYDLDPTWSPDGRFIAFTRYEKHSFGNWEVRATGLYDVATGVVSEIGPLPREVRAAKPGAADAEASSGEGFWLDWSPDGRHLVAFPTEAPGRVVVIDVDDGSWRTVGAVAEAAFPLQAWQRLAAP